MLIHWAGLTYHFIVNHWTDVGVGWFIADRIVKWTPWTEDDEALELLGRGFKKIFGTNPKDIIRS